MDGIIGDRFAAGRRIRPATQEFAVLAFPSMIVAMLQGRLQILPTRSASGPEIVRMWIWTLRKEPLTVTRADFDLIKQIAETSTLRVFPSETPAQSESRIRARVLVEFAGRGVPA